MPEGSDTRLKAITGIAFDSSNHWLAVSTLWGGVFLFKVWGSIALKELWCTACLKFSPMAVGFTELRGGVRDVLSFGYSGMMWVH
jgi:hypothetical protein